MLKLMKSIFGSSCSLQSMWICLSYEHLDAAIVCHSSLQNCSLSSTNFNYYYKLIFDSELFRNSLLAIN